MRILFLTPYFVPDYAPSSPIYAALVEHFARRGHTVVVVTGMPYYGRERLWDEYRGKWLVKERMNGVTVIRVYTYVPDRRRFVTRAISYGLFNVLAAMIVAGLGRFDVCFAANPGFSTGLPLLLVRLRKTPVVYSVEDVYPDVAIRLGVLTPGLATSVVAWLERLCYNGSACVRVLSHQMGELLARRGVPRGKIRVISNFADTDFVCPQPKFNRFRERYGFGDKFVVLYAGNIGFSQSLDTILEAADRLRDVPDIVFVLIGEGAAKEGLEASAQQRGLHNVYFLPFQPREDLPLVLGTADASLVVLRQQLGHESVPSKTYWILASGRPIVAAVAQESEVGRLVVDSQCGIRVDPEDPDQLARAILYLRDNPTVAEAMGLRARLLAESAYSLQSVATKFVELFEELVVQPRGSAGHKGCLCEPEKKP